MSTPDRDCVFALMCPPSSMHWPEHRPCVVPCAVPCVVCAQAVLGEAVFDGSGVFAVSSTDPYLTIANNQAGQSRGYTFNIIGLKFTGANGDHNGGALRVRDGNVHVNVDSCNFDDNQVRSVGGAAIRVGFDGVGLDVRLEIRDSTFTNNRASVWRLRAERSSPCRLT